LSKARKSADEIVMCLMCALMTQIDEASSDNAQSANGKLIHTVFRFPCVQITL